MFKHSIRRVFAWVFCYYFFLCMFGMIKTKKKKKLNVLICIEFGLYFKKYFFSFGIWDYNLIRRMYS